MSRILALDLGEKHIGLAISDGLRLIASPLTTIQRRSRKRDFAEIGRLATQNEAGLLLVGIPSAFGQEESAFARWVRDYATALGEAINLPVTFWDESFSTDLAVDSLRLQGFNRKKMKEQGKLDAVAAAMILQNYLETSDWSDPDV